MAGISENDRRILAIFPPGRCRRIYRYLIEHQTEIDNINRQHGELTFNLYRDGSRPEVSTSGVQWKPDRLPDLDVEQ